MFSLFLNYRDWRLNLPNKESLQEIKYSSIMIECSRLSCSVCSSQLLPWTRTLWIVTPPDGSFIITYTHPHGPHPPPLSLSLSDHTDTHRNFLDILLSLSLIGRDFLNSNPPTHERKEENKVIRFQHPCFRVIANYHPLILILIILIFVSDLISLLTWLVLFRNCVF